MKNSQYNQDDYKLFRRKYFTKIVLIAVVAFLAVALDRILYRNYTFNYYVDRALQIIFSLDMPERERNLFYLNSLSPYLWLIIYAVAAVLIILLSRSLVINFNKYFYEIGCGIDTLTAGVDREIKLSPEMASMERKLKTIKQKLERREYEAKSADLRKNELVMYLAHDIKTPLTSVIGYLSLLDEAPDMPMEQKAKYVNITLEKAYRLERLIDEFFEIARYNFQEGRLSKEKIDLYYMFAQMAEEFYPLLSASDKRINLNVREDMTLYGDPDKLARVFRNVLKNAVAYSAEGSEIDIVAAGSEETVTIYFKNPGHIPEDKLAVIFDKFYRLDSARSSDTGGSGLGLAIAKEIIAEHGGIISAQSDNGYTIFKIELPAL